MRIVYAALIALLSWLLAGCQPAEPRRAADFRSDQELRVATRLDAISYRSDGAGNVSGFEHDLLRKLGERLGVPVRFTIYPDAAAVLDAIVRGEAHIAAAGLGRNERLPLIWSAPLRDVDYVLVGRGDTIIERESELAGRTVSVRRGSLAADFLETLRKRVPGLKLEFPVNAADQRMLEQLAQGRLDLVATDRLHYAIAALTAPDIGIAFDLPFRSEIAWAMPPEARAHLAKEVDAFIAEARESELLARIADRYFGHVRRLDERDINTFLARIQARLPKYRAHFHEAQAATGVDWRFIAALAYQESHWDPLATSWSGVRGMMMLTSETADRLGVQDRLDARASILGGARYFTMLRDLLPDEVPEPDRSWMATAAYNLGMGHLNGARQIAQRIGQDNTSWLDMKAVLPLMSRPEYAARLKAGAARGGEAVIMAENVRNYHDILMRLEAPYTPPLLPKGLRLGGRERGAAEPGTGIVSLSAPAARSRP